MTSPHDRAASPDGRAVSPHDPAASPGGRAAFPHDPAASPDGRAAPLHDRAASPQPPDGQAAGALSALRALSDAISETARVLPFVDDDDDATAYQCSRALDSAFADLAALLETVPGLVGLGDPGRVVSERLQRSRERLAARRADIAAHRARLDELAGSERDLDDLTAQADRLRDRVGELERASMLAEELPALRRRADALERSVSAVDAASAEEASARIRAAATEFTALTRRQRDAAGVRADRLAAEAEETARAVDELRARGDEAAAELARREDETRQLETARDETLRVLSAWRQADADLAEGLRATGLAPDTQHTAGLDSGTPGAAGLDSGTSPLRAVQAELAQISERLTRLDDALRPLLADHAQAYEEARRPRSL